MTKVKYNIAIDTWRGPLDTRRTGQAKRERLVSRYRKGSGENHQVYPMKMHEGPWSEGATANRELMKTAQKEAHAIERAAKHPENATSEYIAKAAMWQKHFADYKSTKTPADKQYGTLYTYTYAHLYRELKAGRVLSDLAELKAHKEATYQTLIPQINALIADETDLIANMANIAAVLHNTFHFLWTGFYLVKEKEKSSINNHQSSINQETIVPTGKELVLGPFQGPIACTHIPYGKGVCGTAWAQNKTLIVPNVHEFPGHIACSSASKSEIVVPIRKNGEIIAVLDIDSADYNTFDAVDQKHLEQITL